MTEPQNLGAAGSLLPRPSRELQAQRLEAHRRHHAKTWSLGLPMLGAGAALTYASAAWSLGAIGLLALTLVFGGLFWIALGLMRGAHARLQRRAP